MKILREAGGYLFSTAGVGLGVFAWYEMIAWWWGLLGALMFVAGWQLLTRKRSGDMPDGGGWFGNDLRDGDIDFLD
jgi:hypothetical protein